MSYEFPAMPSAMALYAFPGRFRKFIDGDTYDLELDLGFHLRATIRVRMLGINTPELHGATKESAEAALDFVLSFESAAESDGFDKLIAAADDDTSHDHGAMWPLVVRTHQTDAFGRYLAIIWNRHTGECLNAALVASGHAVAYMQDKIS